MQRNTEHTGKTCWKDRFTDNLHCTVEFEWVVRLETVLSRWERKMGSP